MEEQIATMHKLNDFLGRRGLRANFVARQVGIGEASLYCFKGGHKLLTNSQIQRLQDWMDDYDRRLDGAVEGGVEQCP